jgi:capsular polysaccharide biosynthesis protein
MNDALDRGGILNVAMAEPPTVPALPARSFSYYSLLGILLATIGSIGLAFTADFLDTSFRTPDEVSSLLGSPVLASIPQNGRGYDVA